MSYPAPFDGGLRFGRLTVPIYDGVTEGFWGQHFIPAGREAILALPGNHTVNVSGNWTCVDPGPIDEPDYDNAGDFSLSVNFALTEIVPCRYPACGIGATAFGTLNQTEYPIVAAGERTHLDPSTHEEVTDPVTATLYMTSSEILVARVGGSYLIAIGLALAVQVSNIQAPGLLQMLLHSGGTEIEEDPTTDITVESQDGGSLGDFALEASVQRFEDSVAMIEINTVTMT